MTINQIIGRSVKIRDGHDNFFTPLRLIFASLVLIGHAYVIIRGQSDLEPMVFYHYTFSYIAVNMFFIASGFLVTKSMLYRKDSLSFISARALRIYPALIIHVLFVMLIIGPLATNIPLKEFFTSPDWYLQPLKVLTFYKTEMSMPGIFSQNHEPLASAALWTLRYEFLAYVGTWILFLCGLLRQRWMILAQFILPSIGWVIGQHYGVFDQLPATIESIFRFGIAYGLGATLYAYRDKISFNLLVIPVFLAFAWLIQSNMALLEIFLNLILAWGVMIVAYMKAPRLAWSQNLSDISYGIYIYHWAIFQTLYHFNPSIGLIPLIFGGFVITVILSQLSWRIIEKPSLKMKTPAAQKLQSLMTKTGLFQKVKS